MGHIKCNYCGEKGHYDRNIKFYTKTKLKEDVESFRNMKQGKYDNNTPGGGDQKASVNVKYASCSLIIGYLTKEWGESPSPVIMLCQTSEKEVLQTDTTNDKMKKGNAIIIHVVDTILDAVAEASINENWCLLDNQSTCNSFINVKYLSNIRYDLDGQYLRVHCKLGVTHTNKIGYLPVYSDPVWYNSKGISNILFLCLVQNNKLVTYNSQD